KAAGRATPPIGISADWKLLKSPAKPGPDGKARWAVHAITAVNSGDVVIRPSAGGSFDRILEGVGCQVSGVGEVEIVDGGRERVGTAAGRTGIGDAAGPDVQRAIDAALLPYKQQLAGAVLESKLQASGLPAAAQQHVRGQFAGRVFEAAEVDGTIAALKGLLGDVFGQQAIRGVGSILDPGRGQGTTPLEEIPAGVRRLFGAAGAADL